VKFNSGAQLTPQEKCVYFLYEMRNLNMWEMAIERYNNGVISEQTWNSWSIRPFLFTAERAVLDE